MATPGALVEDRPTSNRSIYYRSLISELTGQFDYRYAADGGELDATFDLTLVIRSVRQTRDGRTEYWRVTESLGTSTATLAPGESAEIPFAVNVTAAGARADRIHTRLDDAGRTRMSVNVSVALAGTAGGRDVRRTMTYALPISTERSLYRVGAAGGTQSFTTTEQVTVAEPPDPLGAYAGPAALALAVVGLVGVVFARHVGAFDLTPAERAWLEYTDDRADFDDWISTVRLPLDAGDRPVATADSLADLADVAIDTNNPVLASPDGDRYHVVHGDYLYLFDAPPHPSVDRPADESMASERTADGHAGDEATDDGQVDDGNVAVAEVADWDAAGSPATTNGDGTDDG